MDSSEAPLNDASAAHTQQTLDGYVAAADEIHRENANHTWATFRAKARELKYSPSTTRGVWEDYKKIVENVYTDPTLAFTASHILHECKDDPLHAWQHFQNHVKGRGVKRKEQSELWRGYKKLRGYVPPTNPTDYQPTSKCVPLKYKKRYGGSANEPNSRVCVAKGEVFCSVQVTWPENGGPGPNLPATEAMFRGLDRAGVEHMESKPLISYRLDSVFQVLVDKNGELLERAFTQSDHSRCATNADRSRPLLDGDGNVLQGQYHNRLARRDEIHKCFQQSENASKLCNIVSTPAELSAYVRRLRDWFFSSFIDDDRFDANVMSSKWFLLIIRRMSLEMAEYAPLRGGLYVKCKWVENTNRVVNIKNTTDGSVGLCFWLSISDAIHKPKAHVQNPITHVIKTSDLSPRERKRIVVSSTHGGFALDKDKKLIPRGRDGQPFVFRRKYDHPIPDDERAVLQMFEEGTSKVLPRKAGDKAFTLVCKLASPVAPQDAHPLAVFQALNKIELHIWHCDDRKGSVRAIYSSPLHKGVDPPKGWIRVVLLLYKGHYLSVRDPAGLIQEQWSKHHGHKDMCFRCLKLHSDRAKLHLHYREGLCAKLTEAVCNLPSKSKCSFNFGRNAADASSTLPCPFFLQWDTEAFTQLIRMLTQAEQAGFKPRYDAEQGGWHCEQWGKEHQLSGIGVVACCPHPEFEAHMKQHKPELHKLLGYRQYKHGSTPEDMMRWFFELIIKCSLLARYWLTDASEPLAPSPAELDEFESASKCVICLKGFTDATEAELNDMFDEIMPLLQELKELMPEAAEGNLTWSSPPDSWKTLYRAKKPLKNYYNHITATAFGLLNAELKDFVVTGPKCTKCHNASVLKVGSKRETPAYFGCNHCFHHGKPLCVKRLGTEVQLTDRYCSIHYIHADVGALWKVFKEAAGDIKHHHHCHITGKTYGAAHFLCNILASYKNYKTPCFAHFATSYDHHWPIQFAKIAQEVIMEFKGDAEKLADDEGGKESDDEDSMGFAPAEEMKYKSTELIDSDDDSSNELTETEVAQPAAKKQKRIPAKSKQLAAYSGLIGQNAEKLKAFTLWRLVQFNDSFLHLPEKLSDLVDERGLNHAVDCKDTIEFIMKRYKRSYDDAFKLVSAGKAHFPHDAHNSLTFLDAIKELVSKVLMYNRKDSKALSEEDYLFCCWVWKTFGCKTMRDFHDLYLLLDCLLHKDALRKYAVETYENYGINPYKQLTTPSTTTRAMRRHLNRIEEEVEVLNEEDHTPDDYTTNEDGIVGGINGVDGPRYARANHKHLTSIIITPSRILIPNVGEGMDNPRIALGINLESTLPCGYRGTAKDDGKGFEGDQLLAYDGVQEDTRRLCQGTGKVHILPVFDVVDWVTGDVLGQLSIGQVILSEVVTHEPIAMEVRETVAWDWWIPRPERDKDSGDWVRRTHEPIKNAAYIMNPMKPKPVYSDDSKQLVKSSLYLFLTSQGFKLTKVDTVKVVESDYIDIVPLLQHIHLDKMRSAGFFPKTLDRRERLQRERSGSEYLLPTQQCRGELNDVQAQLLQPFSEDDKRGKSLSKEDLRGVRYKATTFYNPTIATTHIDPFDAVNLYGASMSKPLPKRGYARANWPRLKESDRELTDAKMLRDLREKVKNEAAAWEQVADAEVELASLDEETDDATDAVQSARKKVEVLRANAILEELHGMQLDVTVGPPKDPATMYDHRDLPMLLNRRKVEYAELSDYMKQQLKFLDKEHDTTEKLVLDFHPKRITVDYHFLAFMLEHGYEVLEIHQLITYEQSRWLAGYVAFNTAKRVEHDKVGNKAGVRTAKNMINMMYGRLAQRVRDYKNLEHVTCEDTPDSRRTQLQKVSDPLFTGRYVVNDEGVIISKRRMTHKLDKKPDAAVVVLWDSKLTMFQGLYYGRVKPHLQRKGIHVQSLSKDTDCMKLLTVSDDSNFDIYRELAEMQAEKPMFDFSDIPKDFPYGLYEDTYRKRPGFFSHDSEGKFIIESGTTRSKVYSDLFINGYSHKERGKGTPKYTVKAMSSHFHVMRCIRGTTLENQKQTVKFMKIGSDNHHLFSKEQERLMHVNIDSKRYQLDAIESIPFGLPLSAIPEISQDIDRFTSDASSV